MKCPFSQMTGLIQSHKKGEIMSGVQHYQQTCKSGMNCELQITVSTKQTLISHYKLSSIATILACFQSGVCRKCTW